MRRNLLRSLEAVLVGLSFVQTVRFLYAQFYAQLSSADLVLRVPPRLSLVGVLGVVDPRRAQNEVALAALLLLILPLLGTVLYRTRWSFPLAVGLVGLGRILLLELPQTLALAGALALGASLLYLALLIVRRPRYVPIFFVAGWAGDQVIRALYTTLDPTLDPRHTFLLLQTRFSTLDLTLGLAVFALFLTMFLVNQERHESRLPQTERRPSGFLSLWGGVALGGILYLEFSVLGLAHVGARWAGLDYTPMVALLLLATLLPLVPEIRHQASYFLSTFDGAYRGWLWALLLVLFVLVGGRFQGVVAGIMLTLAQFFALLTLWWMVRPASANLLFNPTAFSLLAGMGIFLMLTVGDYFTYDYAYVRPFIAPFTPLSDFLTGLRGGGLALLVMAVVFTCLPMILERRAIPWRYGQPLESLVMSLLTLVLVVVSTSAALPAPIRRPLVADCLRVATYNIHGGYTQFFAPNLELVAQTLERSGADIVLLQEVETGRLTSGSADQVLWLAHRLNMQGRFFPLNEKLQGLAVLSRLDATQAGGMLLTSPGAQAGVQTVRYRVDESGDFFIYNVWLSLLLERRGGASIEQQAQDQVLQVEELNRLIAANHFGPLSDPLDRVILGGTFNHPEDSPLYDRWAETVFLDPFSGLFAEDRVTFVRADGVDTRFDYLWLYNLAPSGIIIDSRSQASDHRLALVAVGRQANQACPTP